MNDNTFNKTAYNYMRACMLFTIEKNWGDKIEPYVPHHPYRRCKSIKKYYIMHDIDYVKARYVSKMDADNYTE